MSMASSISRLVAGARDAGWATEPVARRFLAENGVPSARFVWAKTRDEALRGAAELGYPLVAKIVSPRIVHKSDVGGVEVGIADDDALVQVFERLRTLPAFDGVLLDEMVRGGVELIVGAKEDPQFGTVVLCGLGGTSVELYQDVVLRLAPVTPAEAESALRSLGAFPLLDGFRGRPRVNLDALAGLVARFTEVARALGGQGEVASMECNPVFATPERAVVADGRIMLRGS